MSNFTCTGCDAAVDPYRCACGRHWYPYDEEHGNFRTAKHAFIPRGCICHAKAGRKVVCQHYGRCDLSNGGTCDCIPF